MKKFLPIIDGEIYLLGTENLHRVIKNIMQNYNVSMERDHVNRLKTVLNRHHLEVYPEVKMRKPVVQTRGKYKKV